MPTERWSDDIWIVRLQNEPAFSDDVHPLLQRLGRDDAPPTGTRARTGARVSGGRSVRWRATRPTRSSARCCRGSSRRA